MPLLGNGSKFVTHATALTTTSDTDCYVVPANFSSHVEHVMIANDNSGNITYTLKYYEAATTTTHTLFSAHAVSGKSAENIFTVDVEDEINSTASFLENDSNILVFFGSDDGFLHGLYSDGQLLSGWPVNLGGEVGSPVFSDLDGDGNPEVIVGAGNKIYAIGGRVLNFISLSNTYSEAKKNIHENLKKLNWEKGFFRKDIGYKVINK